MSCIKVIILFSFLSTAFFYPVKGQVQNDDVYELPELKQWKLLNYRYVINIPDLDGYETLKCDFHMHTLFSDGHVWPTMRVIEAWMEGLDAIAITEHIEYQKFKDAIRVDINQSNLIAQKKGEEIGILVVRGAEITRKKPLGHINALFLQDVSKVDRKNEIDAINEAVSQGAFLQWNHPGWPNDTSTLYPIHKELIAQKKIKGVEVFNGSEYYPKALDWCDDLGIVYFANSDLHYASASSHKEKLQRPMTLVFAKEHSLDGIKEALIEGRTLAYFNHHLAGREKYLKEFVQKSLAVNVINPEKGIIEVRNCTDINYSIQYGNYMYSIPVKANHVVRLNITSGTDVTFTNCLIRNDKQLVLKLW